jgi:hypothetical protein
MKINTLVLPLGLMLAMMNAPATSGVLDRLSKNDCFQCELAVRRPLIKGRNWPIVPLAGPAINRFSMVSERQESGGDLP